MRSLWRLLALGTGIAIGIAFAVVLYGWCGPGPAARPKTFTVEEGSSVARGRGPAREGGADPGRRGRFKLMARAVLGSGDPVQAGEFEIPKGASGAAILDLLQHGTPVQRLITVTEGMPSIIVAEKLAANPILTGAMPAIARRLGAARQLQFRAGRNPRGGGRRMQAAMTKTLDQLWAKRKPTARSRPGRRRDPRLDRREGDRQGVRAADGRGRLLQPPADRHEARCRPDRHLPDHQGQAARPPDQAVRAQRRSPATTPIAKPGLPIGPIANPGKESIAAVLDPAQTKALYFVAEGDGGHVFADTLAEHNANVQKWYAIRRQRGEM